MTELTNAIRDDYEPAIEVTQPRITAHLDIRNQNNAEGW